MLVLSIFLSVSSWWDFTTFLGNFLYFLTILIFTKFFLICNLLQLKPFAPALDHAEQLLTILFPCLKTANPIILVFNLPSSSIILMLVCGTAVTMNNGRFRNNSCCLIPLIAAPADFGVKCTTEYLRWQITWLISLQSHWQNMYTAFSLTLIVMQVGKTAFLPLDIHVKCSRAVFARFAHFEEPPAK